MTRLVFVTHPEVEIDPETDITGWRLSGEGRRRATILAGSALLASATGIWTSAEAKARETASILSAPRALPISVDPRLGENDRSATGFLPTAEFEAAADAFFARPEISVRGWERAVDAQSRIVTALRHIAARHAGGDLVIVAHGAVGTLLWCSLRGVAIDRRHDQPFQGHYWTASLATLRPETGWQPIA